MTIITGLIFDGTGLVRSSVFIENGVIVAIEDHTDNADITGFIVPSLVNCHTHVGDAGLKITGKMSLEELVAPPNGLKHRYLSETPADVIATNMEGYLSNMASLGAGMFADFREGGEAGVHILKNIPGPDRLIFGRPTSPEYDWNEVESILDTADGIGLPSISDIPMKYIEAVADHTHRRNRVFTIHASERIREDIDAVLSLDPDFLIHMNESSDQDMRRCADSDIPVVICPRSNRYFGKVTPVTRLLDAGVTVGLGTDNAMLCSPDLLAECGLLTELLGKHPNADDHITEILLMNGRKILNHGMEIGIEVGMDAGISIFPSERTGNIRDLIDNAGRPVLTIKGE